MPYTGFLIPNKAAAAFVPQAEWFAEDIQVVADGLRGNGVQTGCVVSQRAAGANMSVDVSAGTITRENVSVAVSSGNLVVAAADATNPRIDVVAVNNAGTKAVTTGTPAAVPAPPAIPQVAGVNNICLAFIYVPAADTAINTNQIIDKRALVNAPGGGGAGTGTVTTTGTPASGNLTQFSGTTSITNGNLSGDVTTAGTLVATIAANVVSYAKIQDVSAASRLIGRGASGSGDPQEITLGTNLSMSGTTLNAAGGGGSTPTGTGFTHITAGAQDAASKLVDTADVNNDQITYAKQQNVSAASRLLGRGSAAGAGDPEEIILGSGLTMTGTTLSAPTGGGGTVTTTGTPANGNLTQFSGAASITNGNLSGDVTTAGTLATNIANAAVTYAKIQNVSAASRLLGRGSAGGAGSPQEIVLGTNLSLSGTTLNASGSGGDVTIRKNTGADVGTRPRLNLIEGSNVTLTVADDAGGNEVDITIAASGGGSSDTVVTLTSDVVHTTNSTTLEDITGLNFSTTGGANELWLVELMLIMDMNSVGGTNADHKIGWSTSGAQTGLWGSNPETGGISSNILPGVPLTGTAVYGSVSNVTGRMLIHIRALIRANSVSGVVQPRFAQNMSGAGAVATVKADSMLIARKIRS